MPKEDTTKYDDDTKYARYHVPGSQLEMLLAELIVTMNKDAYFDRSLSYLYVKR